jgi:hypothetical protein
MSLFKKNIFYRYIKLIPKYRHKLIWISGRDSIEYNNTVFKNNLANNKVVFKSPHNEEPSLIYPKLKINECDNPEPLGYYPSYKDLDPCQRYIYLEWLKDIEEPIEIGYVFLFYYGLERHLLFGDFEKAIYEIDKLRKYHKNSSFQHYSSEAIIFSCLYKERTDLFEKLDVELNNSELLAFTKIFLNGKFYAKDIISSAKYVGFKNERYIKNYPDLFVKELNRQLLEEYSNNYIEITESQIMASPKSHISVFANVSFDEKYKSVPIQKVFENEEIRSNIYNFLSSTHEKVKILLKETKNVKS